MTPEELEEIKLKAKAFDAIQQRMKDAYEEFKKPGRFEKRAQNFLKALGITTGKREPQYDGKNILLEYLSLTMGDIDLETFEAKKPMGKWEAIDHLHRKYGNASPDGIWRILRDELAKSYKDTKKSVLPSYPRKRKGS